MEVFEYENSSFYRYTRIYITSNWKPTEPNPAGMWELEMMEGFAPSSAGIMNWYFSEAFRKGKEYFDKKGLFLPDDRLFKPEILVPKGI